MKAKIFAGLVLLLAATACQKENEVQLSKDKENVDYLVFGDYYGFCGGECAYIFKWQDGRLYADNSVTYYIPDQELAFFSEPLPSAKAALGLEIVEAFPAYLRGFEKSTFGIPDAADQGGIIIELSENGKATRWHIDNFEEQLPEALVPFKQLVSSVLYELKK